MKKYIISFFILAIIINIIGVTGANYQMSSIFTSGTIVADVKIPDNNYFPGTTIPIVPSYWPKDSDFVGDESIHVPAGGVFLHTDGNYYVVVKDITLNKAQASTGPGGDAMAWYATEKLTGRILTLADYTQYGQCSTTNRGDLFHQDDNSYFVYIDGGSWSTPPSQAPHQWYKVA